MRQNQRPRPGRIPARICLHEESGERRTQEDRLCDAASGEQPMHLIDRRCRVRDEWQIEADHADVRPELLEQHEEQIGAADGAGQDHERERPFALIVPAPGHAIDRVRSMRHVAEEAVVACREGVVHAVSLSAESPAPLPQSR